MAAVATTVDTSPKSALRGAEGQARVPRHVAFIMDGNARWARRRALGSAAGHEAGVAALRKCVRAAADAGVRVVSVYAFSTENWSRPPAEVASLLVLLERTLTAELPELQREGVRVTATGDLARLPAPLAAATEAAINATQTNRTMDLCIAMGYSGRQEITRAVRSLAARVEAGELRARDIDEDAIAATLHTAALPEGCEEPDLLIRTSGEMRLSNFMLWQTAYTELYFTDTLWPDFDEAELRAALDEYAARTRRFGRRDAD